jgi:integrase
VIQKVRNYESYTDSQTTQNTRDTRAVVPCVVPGSRQRPHGIDGSDTILSRKPRKAPGVAFTTGTYARSIRSACLRAGVAPWAPNQLRHNAATTIRREFGLEAAQVILGHSELGVTQVYAERDSAKAIEIARRIG